MHILLESKEEGRLATGGERGKILPSKNQPEKRMLCDHTASAYTNSQLYCLIRYCFLHKKFSVLLLAKSWRLPADVTMNPFVLFLSLFEVSLC